jgi:hypothetical protein
MKEIKKSGLDIWNTDDCQVWLDALNSYPQVIAAQSSERLVNLDAWYRNTLPVLLSEREEPFIYLDELQGIAAWKMTRGVWRERNRYLISQNTAEKVEEVSRLAFSAVRGTALADDSQVDHGKPIKILSGLSGVGPATASAVIAAYAPSIYPFFDELVAEQIAGLGPVAFTARYYAAYSAELRNRASMLNSACTDTEHNWKWTAQDVAQAMWAISGGKNAGRQ